MCGIAGVFGPEVGQDPSIVRGVQAMVSAQTHRGPDDEGWLVRENIILGHRRLSIIDLSEAGRQPMSNEDGTVWIVYNGEIYNHDTLRYDLQKCGHCFRSRSDTEVLIHGYEEWGIEGLLQRLRGMFAFALYDAHPETTRGTLILARDRFGIKPLYYGFLRNRMGLVFASEVQAFVQGGLVPLDDNHQAWLAFLMFGSVPTPWTTLREVFALPPGHYLVVDRDSTHLVCYYALEDLFLAHANERVPSHRSKEFKKGGGLHMFERKVRERLEDTVALHLISDAPLGVFLSGGIDSSALVALAAALKPDLETLSVIFEENSYSEEAYQQKVVGRFRTRHHWIPVTMKDFQSELARFLSAMDQPTVDGVNTYFVARAAQQIGLKAVLSGLGGDEVFSGYSTLRRAPTLWRLRSLSSPIRGLALDLASIWPRWRKLAFLKYPGVLPFYLVQRGLFTPKEAAQLLGAEEREAWEVVETLEPRRYPKDPRILQQFLEARHYLTDQLLKDADVFGMAHSVEIRVPLLDHILVEMILAAPLAWRLDSHRPKPLLTRPLKDLLPPEVVFRPKQGFTFPMEPWLHTCESSFETSSGLDVQVWNTVWNDFRSRKCHWSRPWALFILGQMREGRK